MFRAFEALFGVISGLFTGLMGVLGMLLKF
jgi:hypothetical protein